MSSRLPGPRVLKLTNWHARVLDAFLALSKGGGLMGSLHRRYGPVLQTSRNELSVNSAAGIRDLYAGARRLDRPDPLVIFHNYQAENLVATEDGQLHHDRRKPIRSIYSVTAVEAEATQEVIHEAVARLETYLRAQRQPLEVKPALRLLLYEIMSHIVYGKEHALNLFESSTEREAIDHDTTYQQDRLFSLSVLVPAWLPRFTLWLRRNNLAPRALAGNFPPGLVADRLSRDALTALKASKTRVPPSPLPDQDPESLISRLHDHFTTQGPTPAIPSEAYILSECVDHFWAGTSTTVDALIPLLHHLSQPENKARQARLRRELREAAITPADPSTPPLLPSANTLKKLPFLDAVIRETLRLNPPIPASMTRRVSTREGPVSVCGHRIPLGMVVGASPYVVGRNPDVYERAEQWVPERWLAGQEGAADDSGEGNGEKLRDMKRHFFAFGAGPRMCLGVNVAWAAMRAAVAGVYGRFETELVVADKSGWTGQKAEDRVRFRRLHDC
ncbi:uncharacterized protein HMPREF1541_09696 [Cyphellophora europaea CBS 101466]|uniref:Cytochrome P450 n=1 Tax=Cyphellophora europaea (strain CBS 101466) TaxID=1220924 RepID=W2S7Z2_CYPE1|nr:uncharacterized protein HMPREF1541_09696 [Cyphellophora europaea CBS 101466]ETN44821.1 hypothetical protein HMPREF1541_09696 [Cyphellophora europaea CBS 101466]